MKKEETLIEVTMTETVKASPDGAFVKTFQKGKKYEVRALLAKNFAADDVIKKGGASAKAKAEAENKAAPENKAATPAENKTGK